MRVEIRNRFTDKVLHFVLCDFGSRGLWWMDQDHERARFDHVVIDILDGQFENVVKVLEVNVDEGTCRDVTEDVARAVYEALEAERKAPHDFQIRFMDAHLPRSMADGLMEG